MPGGPLACLRVVLRLSQIWVCILVLPCIRLASQLRWVRGFVQDWYISGGLENAPGLVSHGRLSVVALKNVISYRIVPPVSDSALTLGPCRNDLYMLRPSWLVHVEEWLPSFGLVAIPHTLASLALLKWFRLVFPQAVCGPTTLLRKAGFPFGHAQEWIAGKCGSVRWILPIPGL